SLGAVALLLAAGLDVVQTLRRERDLDSLTGLCNRRAFLEAADRALAEPSAGPSTLIMVDLDYFKRVNDRFGHAAGDQVLAEVGSLLQSSARKDEIVGRYGGEEFLILASGVGPDHAFALADEIRRRIAAH